MCVRGIRIDEIEKSKILKNPENLVKFHKNKCLQNKQLHRVILYQGQVVIEGNLTYDPNA